MFWCTSARLVPVVAEQVIEVPKVVSSLRVARTVLCAPQMADQLVEVPTTPGYALGSRGRANPWVAGCTGSALSSSTPPGQGGIQILAAATGAEACSRGRLCDHAAHVPAVHRRVLQGASASVHRQSGGYFGCVTETGTHCKLCRRPLSTSAVLGLVGIPVVVQRDRCFGLTEQKTVEIPQLQC